MSERCPVCNSEATGLSTCPACGFKMHGSTASFNPIELSSSDLIALRKHPSAHAYLRVLRGQQKGAIYELGTDKLIVGRDIGCNIFLNDMTVSREHAIIEYCDGYYKIIDNNSFNGLWINNENCSYKILQRGDIIQLGRFCLIYEEQ